jgi:Ca-activated chloride channel family protein
MRKPFLLLGLVALVAGACSSTAPTSQPGPTQPPAYQQPTTAPYRAPTAPPYRAPTTAPTAAPTAAPYPGATFQNPGVNPSVDPARDNESTFGLDVDTASYTVARAYINGGNLPDPASVRVEEYVNFFDQGYAAPESDTFAIYSDGGPSPLLSEDEVLLRIGIKAHDVARRERPDAALTFVIDVSGSMARDGRLELVKHALALLVGKLRASDSVAIVVFGTDARVALRPTSAGDDSTILAVIESFQPGGSTNAEAGLRLGYEMARNHFREGGINRVVLASDGVANVGLTDAESILRQIRNDAQAGIQLVTVGVGFGNYNDTLLEQLADQGDGFYAYVDTIDEAERLFVEDLTGTLQSVALDARVQVEFDPGVVETYRLIGFENRAINDNQFRDPNVKAGAIGAGHSVTALYALRLSRGSSDRDRIATISLRWVDPDSNRASEVARDVQVSDLASSFRATAPEFQLDALVSATAERFRHSNFGKEYDLDDIVSVANDESTNLPHTGDVREFLDLLQAAARIDR